MVREISKVKTTCGDTMVSLQVVFTLLKFIITMLNPSYSLSFVPTEKYDFVGKLLKPGEEPTEYSDEESATDTEKKEN